MKRGVYPSPPPRHAWQVAGPLYQEGQAREVIVVPRRLLNVEVQPAVGPVQGPGRLHLAPEPPHSPEPSRAYIFTRPVFTAAMSS